MEHGKEKRVVPMDEKRHQCLIWNRARDQREEGTYGEQDCQCNTPASHQSVLLGDRY